MVLPSAVLAEINPQTFATMEAVVAAISLGPAHPRPPPPPSVGAGERRHAAVRDRRHPWAPPAEHHHGYAHHSPQRMVETAAAERAWDLLPVPEEVEDR